MLDDVRRRAAIRIQTLDGYHPLRQRLRTAPAPRTVHKRWRGDPALRPAVLYNYQRSTGQTKLALSATHVQSHPDFPLSLEQRRLLPTLLGNKEAIITTLPTHPLNIVRAFTDGSKLEDGRTG